MAKREIRPVRVDGQVAYVPLTKGYTAIIDAADVPLVEGYNWLADVHRRPDGSVKVVYAARMATTGVGKQRMLMMHREISGTPSQMMTDHVDGDGLNNRKANLRRASRSQNGCNRRMSVNNASGTKGVHWSKASEKWVARIAVNGTRLVLGSYRCPTAAALAYAKASRELHGEFGRVA